MQSNMLSPEHQQLMDNLQIFIGTLSGGQVTESGLEQLFGWLAHVVVSEESIGVIGMSANDFTETLVTFLDNFTDERINFSMAETTWRLMFTS